jgi:hypothetical protein
VTVNSRGMQWVCREELLNATVVAYRHAAGQQNIERLLYRKPAAQATSMILLTTVQGTADDAVGHRHEGAQQRPPATPDI